jgi:hypothetical protein
MTGVGSGIFVHQWNVSLRSMFDAAYVSSPTQTSPASDTDRIQYMNVGSTIYGNVIMSLKIGILLEWSKTFVPRGHRSPFWWTCHILLGINVVFYFICTFLEIFGCQPREKLWKATTPGTCLDIPKTNIAASVVNFVSDVIILLLPQKVIWSLHMSSSKKAGVAAMFAVGLL